MNKIKKILVPTDFSETADNSLQAALLMAKTCGAELYLVHFYHTFIEEGSIQKPFAWKPEPDEEYQVSMGRLTDREELANHHFPDLKIHTVIHQGLMADEIGVLIKTRNIDLIVCGTVGADWIGEHLFGTNTSAIVQFVKVPVLVVPRTATILKVKKIVFATDFHPGDLAVLREMISLAALFGTTVEILHISKSVTQNSESDIWLQEMNKVEIKGKKIDYLHLISSGSLEDKLMYYLDQHKVDILLLTTKGKSLFERIFMGSLSRKMVCHAQIPVLIYHTEN